MNGIPLLADSAQIYHQFARLQSMTQWWQWLLLLVVCLAVLVYVVVMYVRDSVELPRGKSLALLVLRLAALAGILFFFFDLEKRSQREVVKNSRALLLADTSLSMGIQDADTAGDRRRIDMVVDELQRGELIERLRAAHDVVVYRFDETQMPIEVASFPKIEMAAESDDRAAVVTRFHQGARQARTTAAVAGGVLLVALLALAVYAAGGSWGPEGKRAWAALLAMVGMMAAVVILAVAHLRFPDVDLLTTLWLKTPTAPPAADAAPATDGAPPPTPLAVDWKTELAPRGAETRLGDAVRYLVQRERGGSIAAIVVISDGGQNAGVDYEQSVTAAANAGIPLYAVGLGSDKRPVNVRVADLEAPQRVYPGDSFSVTGYLQAFGLRGSTVTVQLVSSADDDDQAEEFIEEEINVKLGPDGEVVPLRLEVIPTQVGSRTYRLRVAAPQDDHDARDNERSAKVEIVDRKNRVLLFAGGPSREFRFLRNLLFRDSDTTLDVFLQTAQPGASQEGQLLFEFPELADELFEYDCIVAFDPNWLELAPAQVGLLERWVAEKAGGLIVIAGPVHTPQWASRLRGDELVDNVKGLYPVVFYSRGSATLTLGRFASETAWPLQFTRDGFDAEYLWLEDDQQLSRAAWESFRGVYGYYAVKDPKPGARVLARFSDPSTAIDGDLPIYLAAHFYGAGRVVFQASGEMWRIRAVDDAYFERYYTKLIRWVSQGRLLRDSSRGVLLVDKDRCSLGDHVTVQAILTDAQFEPLTAPEVTASLEHPDGRRTPLVMRRVEQAAREGMYTAQFTATLEGDYLVELQPPHGDEDELLTREVRSRIPALETKNPERNDALMKYLTEQTGGAYYLGLDAASGRGGAAGLTPLADVIQPQDQVTYLSGSPDRNFERQLMTWLMGLIAGVLCLEWLIRRLNKLA